MIRLTRTQAELVWWALDPMLDFWCSSAGAAERDGKLYDLDSLPFLTGQRLTLSPHDEINADLLYRLEVQLQEIADSDLVTRGSARAGLNAAEKIRQSSPALATLPAGGGWI